MTTKPCTETVLLSAKVTLPVVLLSVTVCVTPMTLPLKSIVPAPLLKVGDAPRVTFSSYNWLPLVTMDVVLMVVVPPLFVVKLPALMVPPIVVEPLELRVIASNAPPAPTLPLSVMPPDPGVMVKSRAAPLRAMAAKLTALFVVLITTSAPRVTKLL